MVSDDTMIIDRRGKRRRRIVLFAALVALVGAAAFWNFRAHVLPESSPAGRGRALFVASGCATCHANGIADGPPMLAISGDARVAIPAVFEAGLDVEDIRTWIREGRGPKASRETSPPDGLVAMPAYAGVLDDEEIEDLVAFVALSQRPGAVDDGEVLARSTGCTLCHGDAGQGGVPNPASHKGYIPGLFGADFDVLTHDGDRAVIREWIEKGVSETFASGVPLRLADGYFERQAIKMPAYAARLSKDEIERLVDWCLDVRRRGPLTASEIAARRTTPTPEEPGEAIGVRTPTTSVSDFETVVRPILERACVSCHGDQKQKSRYRLDRRDEAFRGGRIGEDKGIAAIVPGDPANSLLIQFVNCRAEDEVNDLYPMPPLDEKPLTAREIDDLTGWVRGGATWPEGQVLKAQVK